jgi:hypothetical protein
MKRYKYISNGGKLFALAVLFLLSACIKKDLEDLKVKQWSPEIALPVISSHFTVEDIVNKFETGGYLTTDDDQLITVVYTGELFSINAQDVMKLSDIPFTFADTVVDVLVNQLNQARLRSVSLRSGQLSYEITAQHSGPVEVELTIPNARRNGLPFKELITLEYSGTSNLRKEGSLSLDGVTFDLTGESGSAANQLKMRYKAKDKNTGAKVGLKSFLGKLKALHYDLMKGYLGRYDFGAQNDSMRIDIFKNYRSGTLFLDDPRIKVSIKNSFGIPMESSFTNFNGANPSGSFSLSGAFFSEKIDVKHPEDPGANATVITERTIDKSNSSIQNFLAISPHRVSYAFEMQANVKADTTVVNFVTDSSAIKGTINLEVPLQGRIDHIVLVDSFGVGFDEVDEAERVEFKLLIKNAFPFSSTVQLYFLDSLKQTIDSLLPEGKTIFANPMVNTEGVVVSPVNEESLFEMDQATFQRVKHSKQMVIRVQLLSHDQAKQTVKFLSTNFMDIKLGVIAKLKVEP